MRLGSTSDERVAFGVVFEGKFNYERFEASSLCDVGKSFEVRASSDSANNDFERNHFAVESTEFNMLNDLM